MCGESGGAITKRRFAARHARVARAPRKVREKRNSSSSGRATRFPTQVGNPGKMGGGLLARPGSKSDTSIANHPGGRPSLPAPFERSVVSRVPSAVVSRRSDCADRRRSWLSAPFANKRCAPPRNLAITRARRPRSHPMRADRVSGVRETSQRRLPLLRPTPSCRDMTERKGGVVRETKNGDRHDTKRSRVLDRRVERASRDENTRTPPRSSVDPLLCVPLLPRLTDVAAAV